MIRICMYRKQSLCLICSLTVHLPKLLCHKYSLCIYAIRTHILAHLHLFNGNTIFMTSAINKLQLIEDAGRISFRPSHFRNDECSKFCRSCFYYPL